MKHLLIIVAALASGFAWAQSEGEADSSTEREVTLVSEDVAILDPRITDAGEELAEEAEPRPAGAIGQAIEFRSPLLPLNPLAPASAGMGEQNVSEDTVTGREMGLRLFAFEF